MTDQREIIKTHKAHCDERLRGLRAYVKELTETAARHGTDESAYGEDLSKAKCDIEYYEGRSALCEDELGGAHAAFHVYEDHAGEWRWRLKAPNGRVVADSGEGYRDRVDCLHGIEIVKGSKDSPVHGGQ